MNIPTNVFNSIQNLIELNSSISNAYNQKKKWEDEKKVLLDQISFYNNQIDELTQSIKRNKNKIDNEINSYITIYENNYITYINHIKDSFQQVSNFIISNKYCQKEDSINISDYTTYDFILFNDDYTIDDIYNIKIDDIYNIKYNKITIIDNKQKNESDSIIKTSNIVKLNNLRDLLRPYIKIDNTNTILNYINSTLELNQ